MLKNDSIKLSINQTSLLMEMNSPFTVSDLLTNTFSNNKGKLSKYIWFLSDIQGFKLKLHHLKFR